MENLSKEFEQLLNQEQSQMHYYSKGDVVEGKIVKIHSNLAFVDIGQKTEAVIDVSEIRDLKEGDSIKAVYTGKRKEGYPLLSQKPIKVKLAIEKIKDAFENNKKIKATLKKELEKGYLVEIEGINVFLPKSEAKTKNTENLPEEFEVYVLKIDESRKNINVVVSRKKVIQEEIQNQKQQILSDLKEGDKVQVKVVKVQDNGAVVLLQDLVYGFLPNSLYSWDREKSVKELSKDDNIEVIVKSIDKEKQKIIVSKKDIEPNPWEQFPYKKGDIVKAKVIGFNDFGILVKVDGLKGFIHKSQTHHLYPQNYKKLYKEQDVVSAKIIELDKENQKLKLSITEATENPLDRFLKEYPEGSQIQASIKDVKTKVAFIDLGEIEGILHLEDATWNPKIKNISQILKGKANLTFKVLGKEDNKIRLGLKQFKENPWENFLNKHKVGDVVKGKVIKMIDKGAFVQIDDDIEGFIPVKEISKEKIEIPSDKLSLNQEIEAKIIKMKGYDITLSIKQLILDKEKEEKRKKKEQEQKELQEVLEKVKPKGEGLGTLGELIKAKLEKKN